MTPDQIAAVVAAAIALMSAAAAYLHSATTRQAVRAHVQMHASKSISTVRQREEGSDRGRQDGIDRSG